MMKKEDTLTSKIKDMRREIRKRVEDEFLIKQKEAIEQGRYPWEGMWLKPQEIEKLQKQLKLRDRIAFVEIIILYLLLAGFSYGLYLLLKIFFLPN